MLKIPKRIGELLERNQIFHGFVLTSVGNLSAWISDNKTVFFPEYTDHGFTHLNEVLLTSDSIMSDDSWSHLTPQDAAAMVVSVLLHDCAMHISEDGFYSLISDQYSSVNSRYVKAEPQWGSVWAEFIAEAKRFDSRRLFAIFGDEVPVKDIPVNKIDLTGRDRLLIGEFIRRHHARIAHEIAFNGVPGCDGAVLKFADEPDSNFLDLCGFIARSHNMSLRSAVDRLEPHKKQVHLHVHAPFIMLVLRIADYVQIHSERAPKKLLSIKGLVSPISRGEWKKHHSIVEINQAHTDPEALFVDAEPIDALTFESLSCLFMDIQRELDMSWSVLGEVYGRYEPLTELGITIRRIRSSLDDIETFLELKAPNYIPKVMRFRTADSEMMELLIHPLYGDSPAVGVRELMQNAIDACVELKDLIVKQQVGGEDQFPEDVCVTLVDKGDSGGELVIEDRGIGMTLDVVENYFLNIGASFRNSDRWKKDHQTQGRSNVYRTGRFGIGLLAAYLLGEEIKVRTRNAKEPSHRGLEFSCKKGGSPIILTNVIAEVGTKISIALTAEVFRKLQVHKDSWDWFCLESPKVVRKIIAKDELVLAQSRVVPNVDQPLQDTGWYRTSAEGFDDVIWTYNRISDNPRSYRKDTLLICNGIIITSSLRLASFSISKKIDYIDVDVPSIVVFDQDGRLPINLERTSLVGDVLPFMEELKADLSDYLVTEMVGYFRTLSFLNMKSLIGELFALPVQGLEKSYYSRSESACKFIIRGTSVLPMDFDLISLVGVECLCIDAVNMAKGQGAWNSDEFLRVCTDYLAVDNISNTKQSRTWWVRSYFELLYNTYMGASGIASLPVVGRRIVIKKSDVAEIVTPGYVPKTFWSKLTLEWENKTWSLFSLGNVPEFDADIELLCGELDRSSSFGVVFCYMRWGADSNESAEVSPFAKAWLKQNSKPVFVIDK